jgi:hypothetical protein
VRFEAEYGDSNPWKLNSGTAASILVSASIAVCASVGTRSLVFSSSFSSD